MLFFFFFLVLDDFCSICKFHSVDVGTWFLCNLMVIEFLHHYAEVLMLVNVRLDGLGFLLIFPREQCDQFVPCFRFNSYSSHLTGSLFEIVQLFVMDVLSIGSTLLCVFYDVLNM